MRSKCRLIGAAIIAATLSALPAAADPNPLIGTWQTTIGWDGPAGLLIRTQFSSDGHVQEVVQNRMGMAYQLLGTYSFDAGTGALRYVWNDYAPKVQCFPIGCQPMPAPPDPMGVVNAARIQLSNPNFFVGVAADGTAASWVRMN